MSLLTSLISYWKLDEVSGTRVDSHGTNDLTDNNTVGSTTGKINLAGSFIAANTEFLSRASNSDFQTGNIDYTFTLWVNIASKPNYMGFITKDDINASREYLVDYDVVSDRFAFANGTGLNILNTILANNLGSPSAATWYFIVAWQDVTGNSVNIQVNDGTVDTATRSGTPGTGASAFQLGAFASAGLPLPVDGLIDEVGFWKRILTAQERTDLYNAGNGFAYPFTAAGGTQGKPLINSGLINHGLISAGLVG